MDVPSLRFGQPATDERSRYTSPPCGSVSGVGEPVRIGRAVLYLGDCRDILPTLGPVDAVVTDPPYGIGLVRKSSDYRDSKFFDAGASLEASTLYADDPDIIRQMIAETMPAIIGKGERAVVFCGPAMLWAYPEPASLGSVFTMAGAGRTAWGFQCTHPVLFYGKDPFLQDGMGGRPNSYRNDQPNTEKINHPCPKPLAWMQWAVWRGSREGETILDPFMGSGTTGVAAVQMARDFIGIEREPAYFEIACRRIEDAQRQHDLFLPCDSGRHPEGEKPEALRAESLPERPCADTASPDLNSQINTHGRNDGT